jgi:nucleoside phosphorylase
MILVTFALPAEGEPFMRCLRRRVRSGSSLMGELHGQPVGVVYVGIGFKQRDALERYLDQWKPCLVICSGFAGSLRSLVRPGDFLIARNFSTVEFAQPYLNQADAVGEFLNVTAVTSAATKAELAASGSFLAIDMESAGVIRICAAHGVPVLVARMVSDAVDEEIPGLFLGRTLHHPREMVEAARFVVRMLALRPRLAGRLSELIRQFALARTHAQPEV